MKSKKLYLWILILSIAGTLFAGTLAYRKYVQNVCSFRESCPIFLGQPVCIYGFIIFLALLVLSLLVYSICNSTPRCIHGGCSVFGLFCNPRGFLYTVAHWRIHAGIAQLRVGIRGICCSVRAQHIRIQNEIGDFSNSTIASYQNGQVNRMLLWLNSSFQDRK
jgi:hypothetical protein